MKELTSRQLDALLEVSHVGAGNATKVLSEILEKDVRINVPVVKFCKLNEIADNFSNEIEYDGDIEEMIMSGILVMLSGDIDGMLMFLFDTDYATELSKDLIKKYLEDEEEDETLVISAITELVNIICGAYLKAFGEMTDLEIIPSVPMYQQDMLGALLSIPAIQIGEISDDILLLDTRFTKGGEFKGYYLFIPDEKSYKKILEKLE